MTGASIPSSAADIPPGASQTGGAASTSLHVVRVCLGALHVALEAAHVQALTLCSADTELPTLEALLGLPQPDPDRPRRCLHLRPRQRGDAPTRLSVPAPLTLQHLAASAITPLPPLLAACCRMPGLRALSWQPQGLVLLVDVRRLALGSAAS